MRFTPWVRDNRENGTIVIFSRKDFVKRKTIFIAGAVEKPRKYEFFPGMHVSDLIRMSGGLLPVPGPVSVPENETDDSLDLLPYLL